MRNMFICKGCGDTQPFVPWRSAFVLKTLYYLESEPVYDENTHCSKCFFGQVYDHINDGTNIAKVIEGLWNRGFTIKVKHKDHGTEITMKFCKRKIKEILPYQFNVYKDADETKPILVDLVKMIEHAEPKWWRFNILGIPRKILFSILG